MIFKLITEQGEFRINPDPARLTAAELVAVERNTGLGMLEFAQQLQNPQGSARAISALVWIARRRAGDYVKWAEFLDSFHPLTLEVEVIRDEVPAPEPAAEADTEAPAEPAKAPRGKPAPTS